MADAGEKKVDDLAPTAEKEEEGPAAKKRKRDQLTLSRIAEIICQECFWMKRPVVLESLQLLVRAFGVIGDVECMEQAFDTAQREKTCKALDIATNLKMNLPKYALKKETCSNLRALKVSMRRPIMELYMNYSSMKIMSAFTIKLRDALKGNAHPDKRNEDIRGYIIQLYLSAKKEYPILSKGICLEKDFKKPFAASGIPDSTNKHEQGVDSDHEDLLPGLYEQENELEDEIESMKYDLEQKECDLDELRAQIRKRKRFQSRMLNSDSEQDSDIDSSPSSSDVDSSASETEDD